MILILSQEADYHTDVIMEELNRRHLPAVRFHTADLPQDATLTARSSGGWSSSLRFHERSLDLSDVSAVLYRRPSKPRLADNLTRSERRFAQGETTMALGGLLETMDCLWINHPMHLTNAAYKPYQLEVAARGGFRTPRSIITNSPDEFLGFVKDVPGDVIYKPLSYPDLSENGAVRILYTTVIDRARVDELAPRVRHCPCLFQEYVDKRLELRVTVVGDEAFAVAIHSQENERARRDWRNVDSDALRHEAFDLPAAVRSQCVTLVKALGLNFGAIDLILTPGDELVFLEVNPNGQWVWLEEATGVPIKDAIVRLLASGTDYLKNQPAGYQAMTV
jgi:glutathione synthase/RimK-type ligase-like ATP-grasp enzyme